MGISALGGTKMSYLPMPGSRKLCFECLCSPWLQIA